MIVYCICQLPYFDAINHLHIFAFFFSLHIKQQISPHSVPLGVAAQNGHAQTVQRLLEGGAITNHQDTVRPLLYSVTCLGRLHCTMCGLSTHGTLLLWLITSFPGCSVLSLYNYLYSCYICTYFIIYTTTYIILCLH